MVMASLAASLPSCAGPWGTPRRGAAHRADRFVPRPPELRRDAATGPLLSVSHATSLPPPPPSSRGRLSPYLHAYELDQVRR
jgi:hypothetical protein